MNKILSPLPIKNILENPYSTENRYTFDLLSYSIFRIHPKRVRIATNSIEMANSIVRRLAYEPYELLVENSSIQQQILKDQGIRTLLKQPNSTPADAAVFPFSLSEGLQPENEPTIIVACWNAISYKSLIYPGFVKHSVFTILNKLSKEYTLSTFSGIYSPQFIVWWALAKLVERLNSAWYFRMEDIAKQRLVNLSPFWRLCYLVVFTGRLKR